MPKPSTLLWILGVFVCFLDYPAITVGGSVLKVAFAVFPFIFACTLIGNSLRLNKDQALICSAFVGCMLPSVALSTDFSTSIKFMFGVIACIAIMMSMYRLTRLIGFKAVNLLVWIYRISVIATIPLYLSGVQERGHFTFYEPSYWAIALIPYFCVAFHKMLTGRRLSFLVDAIYILAAVMVSKSVSMVLWIILCFAGMLIAMNRMRLKYVIAAAFCFVVFGSIAYETNRRAHDIIESIGNIDGLETMIFFFMYVGGNRLQRVLVAYQAVHDHPFFGVGLGALKNFTDLHFRAADFAIQGSSAPDFDIDLPATNIFLEMAAECGIIGLISFLYLLRYVFKELKNKPDIVAFRVALFVTMLSLMIESSYLRPYVWMLYGISLGLCSLQDPRYTR